MTTRFLTQEQTADQLAISKAQVYALIRRGDLRALKIGGRGVWRVAQEDIEGFIQQSYTETAAWIAAHPFTEGSEEDEESSAAEPPR